MSQNFRHPDSLTCPITEQHVIFVKTVLRYADSLKSTRLKVRKRFGKHHKAYFVHGAKLNTLQHVLAIFDKTIVDIDRVKAQPVSSEEKQPRVEEKTIK